MNKFLIIFLAVIAIGGYVVWSKNYRLEMAKEESMMSDQGSENKMREEKDGEKMMEQDKMMEDKAMVELKFSGAVLAGSKSLLLDFNKDDYEKTATPKNY